MMEYNAPPGADGGTMEDQVIQLDASFDARAQYTMLCGYDRVTPP